MILKITNDFSIPFLDCLGYCGYKYLCLILYVLLSLMLNNNGILSLILMCLIIMSYFGFCY